MVCKLLGCATFFFVLTISLVAQEPTPPATDALAGQIDPAIIDHLLDVVQFEVRQKRLPAFSIGVVDGQRQASFSIGFGHEDAAQTRLASGDTVYRVGSVSKLFTDLAVMQLVERGELSLDEDLRQRIPELHPQGADDAPITLRQLMSHRAGLVRESPVGNYFDDSSPSLRDTVLSLNETAYVYPPGTRTKYSNAGIAVVGYVIEQLKGVPFADYMDRNIFGPLGMTSSSFRPSDDVRQRQATGWMWTYDGRRFEAPDFALGTLPAGNLYASINDLCRFLQVILNDGQVNDHQLLMPQTLSSMMTPQRDPNGQAHPYGIGFRINDFDGHRKIGHGGAVYGFATQLEALPDDRLGVAAVASLDVSNGVVERVAHYALRLMLASRAGQPLPPYETTTDVPTERASQLEGRYVAAGSAMRLERFDNQLLLRRGSGEYHVRDRNGTLVVDDVQAYGPEIQRDSEGSLQIGDEQFRRVEDPSPAPSPARWNGLIGEYGWDHNTLYILEDRGQLVALIEWFFYYPLTELGENEFAFPETGLYHGEKLIFVRDPQGQATEVIAASVRFPRRPVGLNDADANTFRIQPVRPVDELRAEALAATPPAEVGEFRQPELVEVVSLDASIKLDIRYATTNNFMSTVFYGQPRAFLQRPAAEALVAAHQQLQTQDYGLLIHDAYRPWYVTKMFWDATPRDLKDFVANPATGSRHNRGCAVDLTLFDRQTGAAVPMVAGYDEFSPRSFPHYPGGTSRQRWHRRLLRKTMESAGFSIYEFEWWHFDFRDWQQYPLMNDTFEALLP